MPFVWFVCPPLVHFNKDPLKWSKSPKDGGISESDFRTLLIGWVKHAWLKRDTTLITKNFKKCGFYNAMDGSENNLISVRGFPDYTIDEEIPDDEIFMEDARQEYYDPERTSSDEDESESESEASNFDSGPKNSDAD